MLDHLPLAHTFVVGAGIESSFGVTDAYELVVLSSFISCPGW